jgi:hypothetical protein
MLANQGRRLTFKQLKERGWPYSRQHTFRLAQSGKIPSPRKPYPGARLNTWDEALLQGANETKTA